MACATFAAGNDAADLEVASKLRGGLVVHLGCGDGALTADLAFNDHIVVHGLDRDAGDVERARAHVTSRGLYGAVTISHLTGDTLPYVANLVNLVVVEDTSIPETEILRVLAPRGVICRRAGGSWVAQTNPWPAELDEWTHWLYGPDNNAVSKDRAVGIARGLQWVASPAWGRHHNLLPSLTTMVSARGRIYYIIDDGPIAVRGVPDRWSLHARDAFNGLLLWKRPVSEWGWKRWSEVDFSGLMRFKFPGQIHRRLVADGDILYATMGFDAPVVALDGSTGQIVRTYEGTERTSEMLFRDGVLYLARNAPDNQPGKDVTAVDAKSGRVLWTRTGFGGISAHGDELKRFTDAYLTAGPEHVYFLDGDDIVALDASSGSDSWRVRRPERKKGVHGHYQFDHSNLCTLVHADGVLLLAQMAPFTQNLNTMQTKAMVILALDAKTGARLWERPGMTLAHFTPPDLFVTGGKVWTFTKGDVGLQALDLRSGSPGTTHAAKSVLVGHHHRCYRNKATERYYLAGEEGIEYIDFATGAVDVHHWLRGACQYGLLPANGLIYLPTHACGCHTNVKLNGFLALASPGIELGERLSPPEDRLVVGAAVRQPVGSSAPAVGEWPVYKHDNTRSNCTRAEIAPVTSTIWTRELGPGTTAPVVASGKVFVGSLQDHAVTCLDAATGEEQWRVTTDGPIDTPPTYHGGRLYFGTRSGSAYSLAAETGELAWRFRAAPHEVYLSAHGRIESAWPVNGSVVVVKGRVYCVAGRSMHLDSGLHAYALDAGSGRQVAYAQLKADTKPKGELNGAVLPDILVSDGTTLSMRTLQLSLETLGPPRGKGGALLAVADGGLLDGTWFNGAFWRYRGAQAQMLVFDETEVVGIRSIKKFITKSYSQDIFAAGKGGYDLFAAAAAKGETASKKRGRKKGRASRSSDRWSTTVPIRAYAMVLSPRYVVLAGTPDVVSPDDPTAAIEGRAGGVLAIHTRSDGKQVAKTDLEHAPLNDGLAAAGGRLYLTTLAGSVMCIGE
jgi:outer membrane protein assembly factor BamB